MAFLVVLGVSENAKTADFRGMVTKLSRDG
jgi:hypothetical protein